MPPLWEALEGALYLFVFWQAYGLLRLRRFNRWFVVVFLTLWTATMVCSLPTLLRRPNVHLLPAVVFTSLLAGINLLCAWYLARRSFREYAVQFVAWYREEKQSEMMQKASREKLRSDIQKGVGS